MNYHSQFDVGLSLTRGRGGGAGGGKSHIIWTMVLVVSIRDERDEREGFGCSASKGPHQELL